MSDIEVFCEKDKETGQKQHITTLSSKDVDLSIKKQRSQITSHTTNSAFTCIFLPYPPQSSPEFCQGVLVTFGQSGEIILLSVWSIAICVVGFPKIKFFLAVGNVHCGSYELRSVLRIFAMKIVGNVWDDDVAVFLLMRVNSLNFSPIPWKTQWFEDYAKSPVKILSESMWNCRAEIVKLFHCNVAVS